MACYHPSAAWLLEDGSITLIERGPITKRIELPCGQCIGCRLERTRQWAVRCVHEAQLHGVNNAFITLTYDKEHLKSPSLDYRDFQLFMKRLRKDCAVPVRFFMCGEYGDKNRRPHFHACIFGWRFNDRKYWSKGLSGTINYRSAQLEKLWPFGQSLVGDVTYGSAQYIASYIVKKVNGDRAAEHYRYIDDDGVIHQLTPEFCHMSLKPGIGALWYQKYASQLEDFDHVVVAGRPQKPPKYYDKLRRRADRVSMQDAKDQREHKALTSSSHKENNSPERDEVREAVAVSRRNFYKVRKGDL